MAIYPNGGHNSNTEAQGISQKRGEKDIKSEEQDESVRACVRVCMRLCVCDYMYKKCQEASLCLSTICLTYTTGKQQSG